MLLQYVFMKFVASSIIENHELEHLNRLVELVNTVGRFNQIRVLCICVHFSKKVINIEFQNRQLKKFRLRERFLLVLN
jgi:hypothetical protein